MKKIKNLTLKVTSIMEVKDAEVTDEIYDYLCEIYERGSFFNLRDVVEQSKDLFAYEWIEKNMQSLKVGHKIIKMKI